MDKNTIDEILHLALAQQATDIHLTAARVPMFRVHGDLIPSSYPTTSAQDLEKMLFALLDEKQRAIFDEARELDFSYLLSKDYQCRVNIYSERGCIAATIRMTAAEVLSIEQLGLPAEIKTLVNRRKGLIILSGSAGSGKSTTMISLVDHINSERKAKVITIEDPIEFIHQSKKSLIVQREVGTDTRSFANALKYALRQDPDVVVVGEIRDLESISMALTTAETGHLVITTLHAPDTVETINRIIDVYPSGRQDQIRMQLAENLLAVIGQVLISRKDGTGRILATEMLVATMPIRNLIRRGALVEIRSQMSSANSEGMHTLEQKLSELIRQDIITLDTARSYTKHHHMLEF